MAPLFTASKPGRFMPGAGTPARSDLRWVAVATMLAYLLASSFELSEWLASRTAPFEVWQLDELPLTVAALSLGLAWYGWRRWKRLRAPSVGESRARTPAHCGARARACRACPRVARRTGAGLHRDPDRGGIPSTGAGRGRGLRGRRACGRRSKPPTGWPARRPAEAPARRAGRARPCPRHCCRSSPLMRGAPAHSAISSSKAPSTILARPSTSPSTESCRRRCPTWRGMRRPATSRSR